MKRKMSLSLDAEIVDRVTTTSERMKIPVSTLVNDMLDKHVPDPAKTEENYYSTVEYLLRPGEPSRKPSYENGGRWFLEWLLLREPDWAQRHQVIFPRCWPLHPTVRDAFKHAACSRFIVGRDRLSVNDQLAEMCSTENPGTDRMPDNLTPLTDDDWARITDTFKGCCGERIRPPQGPHWDAVCVL